MAGFAGAGAERLAVTGGLVVLVFGLANLFADGVSMGLGAFLSARSQRDVWSGRRRERLVQIKNDPDAVRSRLHDIFMARGHAPEAAATLAAIYCDNPPEAAHLLLAQEDGLSDPDVEDPRRSAIVTFAAFLAFGAIPLFPYMVFEAEPRTFVIALAATLLALVALGSLRWIASGERPGRALGETVGVGSLCAAIAYATGALVGG